MFKILLLSGLLALALSNIHLNIKYRDFINGQQMFDELTVKNIYSDYYSPYNTKSDYRFKVFLQTLIQIRNHNAGKHTWTQGINDFSDMTFEEFTERQLMAPQQCSATNSLKVQEEQKAKAIPDNFEWNSLQVVTPVKNQGNCGSCWTFSTVGSLQAIWNILQKGKNVTFSEQQLVDCAGSFDNHGCNGGLPSHAFQYIKYTGGIESDVTYKYTGKDGKCAYKPTAAVGYVKYGSYNITQGDENELAERLYSVGPIAVAFQVITGFQSYKSGIYTSTKCGKSTKDVNHAVVATGYGVENGVKFWNIKNSWAKTWGIAGYFKIQRGVNMCAIAQCNSYPLVDSASLNNLESSQ